MEDGLRRWEGVMTVEEAQKAVMDVINCHQENPGILMSDPNWAYLVGRRDALMGEDSPNHHGWKDGAGVYYRMGYEDYKT
jgi:hypothetical protein